MKLRNAYWANRQAMMPQAMRGFLLAISTLGGRAMREEFSMATTVQDFVDSIATKAGVDPATAETAIGTILSAIQQEGDATKVGQLFNQIPGAADLAQKHAVVVGSGGGVLGTLSGLASSVVGKDAGVMVAAIGQLEETNLTMEQIKKIGTAVLSYLKESANPALAKEVVDSIPSLREHFGHA
jgi:hypothetical protein